MTRNELLSLASSLTGEAHITMILKNTDYAKTEDALSNFKKSGLVGIVARLEDKIARLSSFSSKGTLAVKDETIQDTCIDIINYAVLYYAYVEDTTKQ